MIDDNQRQIALTALGSALGMASVLLVFVAFVYTKSDTTNVVARARQYRNVARGGVVPLGIALLTAWVALSCLQTGSLGTYQLAVFGLQASIVLTGLYAVLVMFIYL